MTANNSDHDSPSANEQEEQMVSLGEDENKWKKFKEELSESESEAEAEVMAEAAGGLGYETRQQLEDQLNAKDQQVAELKDQLLRAHAEADNVQRRSEREISNAYKYSVNKLLTDLLPIVDSLSRGLEGTSTLDHPQIETMRQGLQLTLDLLEKTMDKYGVKSINPEVGEAFNPEQHEAMTAVPNTDLPPNSVVQVLQKGYQLHDRVLRAAMVMVAA